MAEVDKALERRKKQNPGGAQVALVAMDPTSGEIRALVGGRSYGMSQLNRAVANAAPPSYCFKPNFSTTSFSAAYCSRAHFV